MEFNHEQDDLRFDEDEIRLLPLLDGRTTWPAAQADSIFCYAEQQRKLLRQGLVESGHLELDEYRAGLKDYNIVCRLQSLLSPYLHRECDYR